MKKQLLTAALLLAALAGNTQNESKSTGIAAVSHTVYWQAFTSSRNIHGVVSSNLKPLQYNDDLNTVTFIHRASPSYTGSPSMPATQSGAMVTMISSNWGTTWDSTCIFSDNSYNARFPQGAIYNPPLNTSLNNAYMVGCGAALNGTTWVGGWYASKNLAATNNNSSASIVPNAMQMILNTPPYDPAMGKHDYPVSSFCATDDGVVRTMATILKDPNSLTTSGIALRGGRVVKGSFNAGTFTWSSDSIIPATVLRTEGTKQLRRDGVMAWNEAGTHGYVVFVGAAATATGSNRGWQPIVYKTTNGGVTWVLVPGIDFTGPEMTSVMSHIRPTVVSGIKIPSFANTEGIDVTVDKDNRLHIAATVMSSKSSHNDSLDYIYYYGADNYRWPHTPGKRPYLYDFIGDGSSPWKVITVDSISSESVADAPSQPGYTVNPWSPTKVGITSRIQLSRSPDGKYIVYTWAESDSGTVQGQHKFNSDPNIKARLLNVEAGDLLSSTKINVTRPLPAVPPNHVLNINIAGKAMFHFASPTFSVAATGPTVTVKLPMTVSNSSPLNPDNLNRHWYTTASLQFADFVPTGINSITEKETLNASLFPNPATNSASLSFELTKASDVTVRIYNVAGAEINQIQAKGEKGSNSIEISTINLVPGIYIINAQVENKAITKKLVIE